MRNTRAALEHLAKAVELDPQLLDARVLYGRMLAGESRFAEAIPQLKAAVELTHGGDQGIIDLLVECEHALL